MRFLKLRTDHKRKRKSGCSYVTPIIVDAPRRFAPSKDRKERALKRRECQLITGAHDSGKSRWISRLKESRTEIWGEMKDPIHLEGLMPLSSWIDVPGIALWYEKRNEDKDHSVAWEKLNLQQKAEFLSDYLLDTQALLFIDDAHRLTGRKAQIARKCLLSAKIWIMSASEEGRLPPSIRPIVERRSPQRTNLESDVSYDSTQIFMWLLVVICVASGAWEIGAVLGGLQMLGKGRRATRAD
jgi:hypothetical protein